MNPKNEMPFEGLVEMPSRGELNASNQAEKLTHALGYAGLGNTESLTPMAESYEADEISDELCEATETNATDTEPTPAPIDDASFLTVPPDMDRRERQFEQVYTDYRDRVRRHVSMLMGNEKVFVNGADAESITHEAFIRLLKWPKMFDPSHEEYDAKVSLKAWLFRTASRILLDAVRAEGSRIAESPMYSPTGEFLMTEPEYEEPGYEKVDFGVLGQLPHDLQAKLGLFKLIALDYTTQEIAQILGKTQGTIKSSTHYSRRALQEALQELGYDHGPLKGEAKGVQVERSRAQS